MNTDEDEVRLGQARRELAQWVIYSRTAQIKRVDCPFGLTSTHVTYQARFILEERGDVIIQLNISINKQLMHSMNSTLHVISTTAHRIPKHLTKKCSF